MTDNESGSEEDGVIEELKQKIIELSEKKKLLEHGPDVTGLTSEQRAQALADHNDATLAIQRALEGVRQWPGWRENSHGCLHYRRFPALPRLLLPPF